MINKPFFFQQMVGIPHGVSIYLDNSDLYSTKLYISGYGSKTELNLKNEIRLIVLNGAVHLLAYSRNDKSLCGTYAKLIGNFILGCSRSYKVYIELRGLGYRLKSNNVDLELFLGYSHPVYFKIPEVVDNEVVGSKNRVMSISSYNWSLLNQFISQLCSLKKRNAYKEKGIFKKYERIKLKEGKKKKF